MRAKLLTITIVLLTVAGVSLLAGQQRLRASHAVAEEVRATQAAAERLWRAEAVAAQVLRPRSLQQRISETRLALTRVPERRSAGDREVTLVLLPDRDRDSDLAAAER